jgi:hypothetical protein
VHQEKLSQVSEQDMCNCVKGHLIDQELQSTAARLAAASRKSQQDASVIASLTAKVINSIFFLLNAQIESLEKALSTSDQLLCGVLFSRFFS